MKILLSKLFTVYGKKSLSLSSGHSSEYLGSYTLSGTLSSPK